MSFDAVFHASAGTSQLLAQCNTVATPIDEGKEEIATKTACNKDTGGKRRLQKWTRGSWFGLVEEDTFKCSSHFTSKQKPPPGPLSPLIIQPEANNILHITITM